MICQQCGHTNDSDAVFCVQCSHPLHLPCPKCGTQNSADARFCKQCGSSLDETSSNKQTTRLKDLQRSAPKTLQQKLKQAEEQIEGQRKPVTILFADIVGSTSIAEKLDPEEWKEVVQGAHQRVSEAIHRYEGTIAQLLGDGVLAFFGAPLTHEDDPERAVRAALDLLESIAEYQRELSGFIDNFQMRIGIHTGEVVVGPVGTDERTEYLAVGDAVNIAARLEAAADPGEVLASQACGKFIEHLIDLGEFRPILAKGKTEEVVAAVVLGLKAEPGLARGLGGLRTPFVGREAELAQLHDSFLALSQGQGCVITIVGDAGIGKTRLLEHARDTLPDLGFEAQDVIFDPQTFQWLEGRALSYGKSLSFWIINQLLLNDLGLTDGSVQVKIKAALRKRVYELFGNEKGLRVFPFLVHLLGITPEDADKSLIETLDGESIKLQTLLYLSEYFESMAKQTPIILVLEDLHWADPSSLETLTDLIHLTDRVPIAFVLLMRLEPDHGSWDLALSVHKDLPHRLSEIQLRRLGTHESQLLIEQLLKPDVLPDDVRELILGRAEGNPLYLEEVIRHLLESELISQQDEQWLVSDEINIVSLPDTLQGLILARIDRLEDDFRDTLQLASVIGKSFLFKLLEAIAEAEQELETHLAQLQRLDLVREKRRYPDLEYIFKHSLTQEAAYNSLLIERRRTFHLRVGEAIEELFPDRIEEFLGLLAHHYYSANALEKAAEYLVRAGDMAWNEVTLKEAIEFYKQAGDVYQRLGNPGMVGQLETRQSRLYWEIGDRQSSIEHLDRALEILEKLGDDSKLAWVYFHMSTMHMLASEVDDAISWGKKALVIAERLDDKELLSHTLNTIGCARCQKREMEEGLSYLSEGLRISLDLGEPSPIARAYLNLGSMLFSAGRYREAISIHRDYHDYFEQLNDRLNTALALLGLATTEWFTGQWALALARIPKFREPLIGIWGVWATLAVGTVANSLGKPAEACQVLESQLNLALRANESQTTVPYLGELARAYATLGRTDAAQNMIEQYLTFIDCNPYFHDSSIDPLRFGCQWFAVSKDPSSLKKCREFITRLGSLRDQFPYGEATASLEEAKGYLTHAEGEHNQAIEHLREASEVWQSIGRPYDQARALGFLGHALVAADKMDEAAEAYGVALAIIGSLADQLEDPESKESFLNSQLVSEIREANDSLAD
jgi:class 3 adenylate cyclase/tetratricopeptide (TPR) repeat protein/ribosomal protein L40E